MENKHYSISVEIPKHKTGDLESVISGISCRKKLGNPNHNLHLTIQSKIWSSGMYFKKDLCSYLSSVEPIEMDLDTINHFENERGAVIFMTTGNLYQRKKLEDLYYDINEIIGHDKLFAQRSIYIPHVTLFSGVPLNKIEEIKDEFATIASPISIDISRISLSEKIGVNQWKRVSLIDLGGINYQTDYPMLVLRKESC